MTEWEDRVAINEVLARYGDAVNQRDAALWASAWDEDAEWLLFDPEPVRGKQAIVAAWTEAMKGFPFVIMRVTQGSVSVDGDFAEGRSYTSETAETADGRKLRVLGEYQDRYRKRDGRWAFAYRRFKVLHSEEY